MKKRWIYTIILLLIPIINACLNSIVMMMLLRMVLSLLISSSRMNIYVAGRNERNGKVLLGQRRVVDAELS